MKERSMGQPMLKLARCLLAVALLLSPGWALAAPKQSELVARGRYIADIAACSDCHGRTLKGGPLDFVLIHPIPNWADRAPAIAGIPAGYTEAQVAHLLETGLRPNGSSPRPPMPPFRLTHADAMAVAAYLKSLK